MGIIKKLDAKLEKKLRGMDTFFDDVGRGVDKITTPSEPGPVGKLIRKIANGGNIAHTG